MPAVLLTQGGSGFAAQPELNTSLLLMMEKEPQKPCYLRPVQVQVAAGTQHLGALGESPGSHLGK